MRLRRDREDFIRLLVCRLRLSASVSLIAFHTVAYRSTSLFRAVDKIWRLLLTWPVL
jgi:hypothetical protein